MLQKLLTFLGENNVKILVKYDGERCVKKYTIRLLYNDIKRNSVGSDTDSPNSLLNDIFKNNAFFSIEEIFDFFNNNINIGIEELKDKFGNDCVITILIEGKNENIMYMLYIQTVSGTRYRSDTNYKQLYKTLMAEE